MSTCLLIIMCLWDPMQIVNEKCMYSSLCTTVLLCILLTNSSHTSLIASEDTTTNSRDWTLETGCRCHLLTVNSEGRLTNPNSYLPTLGNERSTSHTTTDDSWIRHWSKSSHLPVWNDDGAVVLTCHIEHGWDWLVVTEGHTLGITGVSYMHGAKGWTQMFSRIFSTEEPEEHYRQENMYKELILKVSQLPWQIYKRVLEQWDYRL